MAFLQCNVWSEALGVCCAFNVLIPQPKWSAGATASDGRYPVLYLLHGLSDDHSIWHRRTMIEQMADQYDVAVVMPAVNRSFYADQVHGYRYFTYIAEELPFIVSNMFPVSTKPEDTFVAGNSMGGYGAFKLALNFPDRYAAAASYSGALDILRRVNDQSFGRPYRDNEMLETFGSVEAVTGSNSDLVAKMNQHARAGTKLPRLYACCGTEDFLLEDNHQFVAHARKVGIPLTYEEGPGAHNWEYWNKLTPRVLEFFNFKRR